MQSALVCWKNFPTAAFMIEEITKNFSPSRSNFILQRKCLLKKCVTGILLCLRLSRTVILSFSTWCISLSHRLPSHYFKYFELNFLFFNSGKNIFPHSLTSVRINNFGGYRQVKNSRYLKACSRDKHSSNLKSPGLFFEFLAN